MFLSQSQHLFEDSASLVHDRKFDTALRSSTVNAFLERKNEEHHWTDDLIWAHYPKDTVFNQDTTLLPKLILWLLDLNNPDLRSRPIEWQKQWDLILGNLNVQHSWINSAKSDDLRQGRLRPQDLIDKCHHDSPIPNIIVALDDIMALINRLPDIARYEKGSLTDKELVAKKTQVNQYTCKTLDMQFTWSNKICIIEWRHEKWILPRPYILQIHNKLADLVGVFLHSMMSSGVSHGPFYKDHVYDFVTEICRLHLQYPGAFFMIANSIEGLCVGSLLKRTEEWMNDELWENLITEIRDTTGIDLEHSPIVEIIKKVDVDVICELGCLTKITGHPLTDIKAGAVKIQSRVQEEFPVSVNAMAFCISSFKENFIRNFILRHKRWPMVDFHPEHVHPAIRYSFPLGIDPTSREVEKLHGRLTWEDWNMVDLTNEMKFNYCNNIIPLLKDKALSIVRSKVISAYIAPIEKRHEDPKQRRVAFQDTRVLLHYLFTSEMETDHIEYIRKFCADTDELETVLDYLVIRLVPKEKELKTLPRFFGCKTFLDRARTIIQEMNVMTYLNLFSEEQGMTLSELSLMKKLYAMQNLQKLYTTHKIFIVNLDAEAWNNKHRDETVKPFAQHTLDPLFGTNLFSRTHSAYKKSFVYIPDEEGNIYWDGQLGGVEGLNQVTWVTIYIHQMKYAFKDTAYKFFQLIHGDDYRVAIAVPLSSIPPGAEAEVVRNIKTRVAEAANMFGHTIKIRESYASENVLCYSKIVYFKTIQFPSALRKIQKTYGATNAFLPILDDYIGSSFSNAHSTCFTSTTHVIEYVVALFWTFYYLLRDKHYKRMTNTQLISISLTPSVVGGLPIVYLHNFFVRGESDLLCSFVHLVQHCQVKFPSIAHHLHAFLELEFSAKKPYALLLKDPYSLPIRKPMSMTIFLRNVVKRKLMNTIRNAKILELFNAYNREALEILIEDLKGANEWQAKPFTALYSSSPFHLIDELLSGFVSAKSIMDLLIVSTKNKALSQRILDRAIKKDHQVQAWRVNVLQGKVTTVSRPLNHTICPALWTDTLRNQAWGLNITTITHPPPQHQIRFGTVKSDCNNLWALNNHFVMTIHRPKFVLNNGNWHHADGGKEPFLGHTTSAGTITPSIRVSEKDPIASKVSNLLTLRSWMNKTAVTEDGEVLSNFSAFTDCILKCYTNTPPHELQKFVPAWKSGSITHRLRAHGFRESVVPNNLLNHYTLVTGETNTHRHFRETREDYTVNYLHIFCYSTAVILYDLEYGPNHEGPPSVWTITTDCEHCNTPIFEPPITIPTTNFLKAQLPPLLITQLGDASQHLIKMAQHEYDQLYPTLHQIGDIDIPLDDARHILIYECLKKSWVERVSLSKRFGVKDMSARGLGLLGGLTSLTTERVLGETEIRALPLIQVLDALASYILHFMLKELPSVHDQLIASRLNTIIPSTLPWFTLVEWYYRSGLLRQLINQCQSLTEMPPSEGCYYNVSTATIYLGKSLCDYASTKHIMFPYICGTVYDTTPTLYHRYLSLYNRELFTHLNREHSGCREYYRQSKDQPLTEDQRRHLLIAYIMYTKSPTTIEVFEQMLQNIGNNATILLQGNDDYHSDDWVRGLTDPVPGIIKRLDYLHDSRLWDMMEDLDTDYIREIIGEEIIVDTEYTIFRHPIGACIDLVRSNPHHADKVQHDAGGDFRIPCLDIPPLSDIPETALHVKVPPVLDPPVHHTPAPVFPIPQVDWGLEYCWTSFPRIAGSSISSCNKFAYILDRIGLLDQRRQQGWICCVGEGEGGVMHYLLKTFPYSMAVFNTYIDDMRSGASAGVCDKDVTTSYRYTKVPLLQGVCDLTDYTTIQVYLREYPQKFWLMTCDADERPDSGQDITQLYFNVISYWLQSRTRNGVLIIKVMAKNPDLIARVCSCLAHYSLQVCIVRVPLSHRNTELYVVACGTARSYQGGKIQTWNSNPETNNVVIPFCEWVFRVYVRPNLTRLQKQLEMTTLREYMVRHFLWESELCQYIIMNKLRIRLDPRMFRGLTSPTDMLGLIRSNINKEQNDLQNRIRHGDPEIRTFFAGADTLKHQSVLMERWCYLFVYNALITSHTCHELVHRIELSMTPELLFRRFQQSVEQFRNLPVTWDGYSLFLSPFYETKVDKIIYHASGVALQLLGVMISIDEMATINQHQFQAIGGYQDDEMEDDDPDPGDLGL